MLGSGLGTNITAFFPSPESDGSRRRTHPRGRQPGGRLGKIAAGCRFQTYYPITPASDESVYLEAHELVPALAQEKQAKKNGLIVVQTEDEIAALAMAMGVWFTGVRSATATSGPGFSLMAEALGWAGMNEVPVVITLYQRGGPATGLPTRHEQGDLRFGAPCRPWRIPPGGAGFRGPAGDVSRCLQGLQLGPAVDQTPVIHLLDKALANSTTTLSLPDGRREKIDGGLRAETTNGTYQRFQFTDNDLSPRAVLGEPARCFWNTGDEHDEFGHISEDPGNGLP